MSIGLSRDAKTILLEKTDLELGASDLWLMDIDRAVPTRWTSNPLWDQHPIWSADNSEAIFFSNRAGTGDLYRKRIGGGDETLFYKSDVRVWPTDWSDDGKLVMFEARDSNNQWDLLTVPSSGNGKPEPFVATRFNERQGTFSPDGKWVAYSSDESGRYEIYIESFPRGGAKAQVSTKGGSEPQWRQDGKEIYFLQEGKISAADVTVVGSRSIVSESHVLVDGVTVGQSVFNPNAATEYAASRDGKRFFLLLSPKESQSAPTTLILNWPAALKKTNP
jgi:Tol biopolymer transport system component